MQLILLLFVFNFARVEVALGYGLPIGSAESTLQSEVNMRFRLMPFRVMKTELGFSAGISRYTGRNDVSYGIDEITGAIVARFYPGLAGDKLAIEMYLGIGTARRYMNDFSERGTLMVIGAGPSFRVLKVGTREVALYADFSSRPGRKKGMTCVESGVRISL